jgi:hypothetical protein
MSSPKDKMAGTTSITTATSTSTTNPGSASRSTTDRAEPDHAEPDHPAIQTAGRQWPEQVTQDEMAELVTAGRAEPWTQPLNTASGSQIPVVARIDGRWYAVLEGSEVFQPASPALARELTDVADRWHQANTALAALRAASPHDPTDLGAAGHPVQSDDRT